MARGDIATIHRVWRQLVERPSGPMAFRFILQPVMGALAALALITCGILALVIAIAQYRWTVHYLWSEIFAPIAGMKKDGMKKEGMQSPVIAIAALLICIGLFAFFAVLLRLV